MTAEAQFVRCSGTLKATSSAVYGAGEIIQAADGRAMIKQGLKNNVAGEQVIFAIEGLHYVLKSTSVLFLPGQEIWWDPTNNFATYRLAAEANGGFLIGLAAIDDTTIAAATTQVLVDVNRVRSYNVVDFSSGFDLETTQTAGVPLSRMEAGELRLSIDATNEAQRADALSYNSIAKSGDGIVEFEVNVVAAAGSATDISLGLANATSATDADAIAESVFIHIDGASQNILAESDDGTTEVAATDTTIDWTAGTKFFVQIDFRDPAGVKIYVNGVRMLSGSTFVLTAATGPMKLLFHVEKTASTNTAEVRVRNARAYRCLAA